VAVTVTCPNCRRPLRLRDESLLGKKTKCPGCRHPFVLELTPGEKSRATDARAPSIAVSKQSSNEPRHTEAASTDPSVEIGESLQQDDRYSAVRQLKQRRSRGRKNKVLAAIAGGLAALLLLVAYIVLSLRPSNQPPTPSAERPISRPSLSPNENTATSHRGDTQSSDSTTKLVNAAKTAEAVPRESIPLLYVPSGAAIVVNMHPARMWRPGSRGDEVRRCLGPLAGWFEQQLRRISGFEPSEIDEALICVILGSRGSQPDVAAVVRLVEERPVSDLLQKFPGKLVTRGTDVIHVGEVFGYFVKDGRTVALAPRRLAEEIFDATSQPAVTDSGIEALLAQTDRNRDLTIVFRPADIRIHGPSLIPEVANGFATAALTWLGTETEAVAWSLQFDDPFTSELLLRNEHSIGDRQLTGFKLQQFISARIASLPNYVLAAVRQMSPRTEGRRKVIGRLPAMTKAVSLGTSSTAENRLATFRTILPERAAPNLALAARLAVVEPMNTNIGPVAPATDPSEPKSEPIAERLKKNVEVDFRRTPLEEAFIEIGSGVGVAVVIDGKALEAAGYTRNMPQEFHLGSVPATKAIAEILKKYDQMVVVVNESEQQLKVTTRAAAEKNGWTIFPIAP
jgi:hypothetical protein